MSKPVFFIVTPSFNQGQFITQTLESVRQQDYQVIHWIMDGGSHDQTLKILQKFGKSIKWQSKPDKGQTDAINQGFKKLKTAKLPQQSDVIVAYINSDDYYLPGALSVVADTFDRNAKAQWVVGDCVIIDSQGNEIQRWVRWCKRVLRMFLSYNLLLICNPIPQPAVFIRLSALEKNGLFNTDLRYVMDYEYWLRLWKAVGAPVCIGQALAAFRIHSSSKGGSQYRRQFQEELQVAYEFTEAPLLRKLHALNATLIEKVYNFIK